MRRTITLHSRLERGWALVVVLAASVVCISLAMALVANRQQAMKLASRQQREQLAALDARIQSDRVNALVRAAIHNQVGSLNTSSTVFDSALPAAPAPTAGSEITDADNQTILPYQVIGQYDRDLIVSLNQYMANATDSEGNLLFGKTLTANLADLTDPNSSLTDAGDPLLGVHKVHVNDAFLPVQLDSTVNPEYDQSIFYAGQGASTDYALREIPLSVYSLYSAGDTALSPDQLAASDAGRVYVNGKLAVSGTVVASQPLVAQTISSGSPGSIATLNVVGISETVGQTPIINDLQLMNSGNNILTSGSQAAGVQVLPTSNFGDPSNAALTQLGGQCEFQISYTDSTDASGNPSGQAQVTDNGAPVLSSQNPTSPTLTDQITQDSNAMNARWDLPNSTSTPPQGYLAAIDPNTNSRLMNKETDPLQQAPMQFIVLDYNDIKTLNPTRQTFYIPGNPNDYALLIRNGADSNGNGQVTNGFSVVTSLDIYVSGGIAPDPNATPVPAISLITSGKVHATP